MNTLFYHMHNIVSGANIFVSSPVALSKLVNLSEPQFLYLQNEGDSVYHAGLL